VEFELDVDSSTSPGDWATGIRSLQCCSTISRNASSSPPSGGPGSCSPLTLARHLSVRFPPGPAGEPFPLVNCPRPCRGLRLEIADSGGRHLPRRSAAHLRSLFRVENAGPIRGGHGPRAWRFVRGILDKHGSSHPHGQARPEVGNHVFCLISPLNMSIRDRNDLEGEAAPILPIPISLPGPIFQA